MLCQTLGLLLRQEPKADEILVIDQTAQHPPEVEKFLREKHEAGEIRWISQETPCLPEAWNRAILEARGEVLLFLDDDVTFEPGFLAAHLANYTDPNVVGISGAMTGEGEQMFTPTDTLPLEAAREPFGWMEVPTHVSRRVPKLPMHSLNLSVRRHAALAVGGFDENFGRMAGKVDFDFGWRIGKLFPGRTWHDPKAAIFHIRAPRGGCRREERWHLPDKDEIYPNVYFFCKNFSLWSGRRFLWPPIRHRVLNKYNVTRPWWLPVAAARFLSGMWKGVRLASGPPHDLAWREKNIGVN